MTSYHFELIMYYLKFDLKVLLLNIIIIYYGEICHS